MSRPKRDFLSVKCETMTTWHFGQYLESLLEKKGGRRAGWHKKRLADETGLAYSYISYLLLGEASGKSLPPSPSIDVFIKLSKALNVPITSLIAAYQGKDPDTEKSLKSEDTYKEATKSFLRALPEEEIFALLDRAPEEVKKRWVTKINNQAQE